MVLDLWSYQYLYYYFNGQKQISEFLIAKCTKRKNITDAFKIKPWFSTEFYMLEIKKI